MLEYNFFKYIFLTMPEMFIIAYYVLALNKVKKYDVDVTSVVHIFALGAINFLTVNNPLLTNVTSLIAVFLMIIYLTHKYDLPKNKLFCTYVFIMVYVFIMQAVMISLITALGVPMDPRMSVLFVIEGIIVMLAHLYTFRLFLSQLLKIYNKFSNLCAKFSGFKF
jgi:hypothetical protein